LPALEAGGGALASEVDDKVHITGTRGRRQAFGGADDDVLQARDKVLPARDEVLLACKEVWLARDEVLPARDEVLLACDEDNKLLPALEAGGRALASEADDEVVAGHTWSLVFLFFLFFYLFSTRMRPMEIMVRLCTVRFLSAVRAVAAQC